MGLLGHFAAGLAAKPLAPRVPLFVLLIATMSLDLLFMALAYFGVRDPTSWSHGLFMSIAWSALAALLAARILHNFRAGIVMGSIILSHWLLDLVSHPIPFDSFSWRSWKWDYGLPLPPDLPLFFGGSPKFGFGLYNRVSAAAATVLETAMFAVGMIIYLMGRRRYRRTQIE